MKETKKTEAQEPKERMRKEYAKKGERGQKMCSWRIDLENVEFLKTVANAGRFINELIAKERERRRVAEIDAIARRANRMDSDEWPSRREDNMK